MSPIDIEDIFERAKYSSRGGDHEETERLLNNYLAKIPESREARLLLGATFAKEGKFSEAAEEFLALLVKDPDDIEALNNAAVIYRRQGKFHEALEYLDKAIEIDPTKAEFHYNSGNIHKQLGNSKSAAKSYTRVVELDPNYVQAYNNLGTIYDQLGEHDKACGVYRRGLTLDHNNPTLHFNYGVSLEASGQLQDAANEYQAALRSKPGWLSPMNNLGIVQFKQGSHDKAISTFKKALSVDPTNAEAFNNIGVVLADQGRTKEAIKNYRKAIEKDHSYTKALANLERLLETTGDLGDAVLEVEKLVKLSPETTEIRNRLAGLYLRTERFPEALEQAETALGLQSGSLGAIRIKGIALQLMGKAGEAKRCFDKILSMEPGNYSFLLELAELSLRHKHFKETEKYIKLYLAKRPNDREAKLLLGKLYDETGNSDKAIQVFEGLSSADPNDTEALAAAADVHKKTGSLEKALRVADTLVSLQGKRATANDLQELNKSLEFYENTVNEYSTSASGQYDKNVKLINEEEEKDVQAEDDDADFLMGSVGGSGAAEEETRPFFTDAMESFSGEEESGELVIADDPFGELVEEEEPLHRNPLDALAEDTKDRHASAMNYPPYPPYQPYPPPYPYPPYPYPYPPYPPYQAPYPDERHEPQEDMVPPEPEPEPEPSYETEDEPLFHRKELSPEAQEVHRAKSKIKEKLREIDEDENNAKAEEDKNGPHLKEVIGLLVYLKDLTGGLPKIEKKSYIKGKFPAALDSVIDSLKNLAIIKEASLANK